MKPNPSNQRKSLRIHLGATGAAVGELIFIQQGRREFSQFQYAASWLADPNRFEISPDLPLVAGFQTRKAPSAHDSVFHLAIADTAPDAWGRRVIDRARAKDRRTNPKLGPLTELDYLCAVDDFSRIGAIRVHSDGRYLQAAEEGRRRTPAFIELEHMYAATRAVESDKETAEDLSYLMGKGTSVGGMRPKCTVLDGSGKLVIGKFPSVNDAINVTRAEVLALQLARTSGIRTASAHCVTLKDAPVAIIERFDRDAEDRRIPYLSAASLLQAERNDERSYAELADAIRTHGSHPVADVQELWRRLVFNLLITNTDDHLQNTGFLYEGAGKWRLAPAFDLNPMVGKLRESKTPLSEDTGAIDSIEVLLRECGYFDLSRAQGLQVISEVLEAVGNWRKVGQLAEVAMTFAELAAFQEAFEHDQTRAAQELAKA
ncbi:MAG TPA: type II toxin-antitoxin system HipA family toxin [Ramlibacter sp.]|nr:type II toxin-antitoxin system HipA family toxin [Ramlibacter sp.]